MKACLPERPEGRRTYLLYYSSILALAVLAMAASGSQSEASPAPATVVVAALDSSERSKALAHFVGDGEGDQEEINAGIQALPEAGGTVLLMEGTYDIRRIEGTLGGVIIDRSNVVLAGQGASTKLVQAPNQDTNVIRIIGSGVGHITIRDLYVDANRDENSAGTGDPNISHDRFEFCGIKAFFRAPRAAVSGEPNHDITIRDCHARDAHTLGIMLEGPNMRVINNVLGNANSDSVEILTGPGEIRGNHVEITGRTHVAIGTDRANDIIMAHNIVRVREGGDLDIAFRSWAESRGHVIAGNVVTVDAGGRCGLAMDIRGEDAAVTGNSVYTSNPDERVRVKISAGNAVVTGNVFHNVVVEVNDQTEAQKPIIIRDNIMDNSAVEHVKGNLTTPGQ